MLAGRQIFNEKLAIPTVGVEFERHRWLTGRKGLSKKEDVMELQCG